MSIIIKRVELEYHEKLTAKQGFTLVEIIVALAIFSLLLGCLGQGVLQALHGQEKSREKQEVIYLVQQIYAGVEGVKSENLQYSVTEKPYSEKLTEKIIRIENNAGQSWTFYYLQEKRK